MGGYRGLRARLGTLIAAAGFCIAGVVMGRFAWQGHSVQSESEAEIVPDQSPSRLAESPDEAETLRLWTVFAELETASDSAAFAFLVENAQSSFERRIVISRWVARDAESALGWAKSSRGIEFPHLVFEEWAKTDPGTAINAAATDTSPHSHQYQYRVLEAVAGTHPDAFFDALGVFGTSPSAKAWDAAFAAMFARAPSEAFEVFHQINQKNRNAGVKGFARQWAKVDPHAALAWADENQVSTDVLSALLEGLAPSDPMTALRRANEIGSMQITSAIQEGFSRWSPEQIIDEFVRFTAADERDSFGLLRGAVQRLLGGVVGEDPQQASALIDRIPDSRARKDLVERFVESCRPGEILPIMQWLVDQPLEKYRLERIASRLAVSLFDPDARTGDGTDVDPEALAAGLKAGPLKEALQRAIDADRAVRAGDYAIFTEWVQTAYDGDAIVEAHIRRLEADSLAEAVSLAAYVGADAFDRLLSDWFEQAPEATLHWASNPAAWNRKFSRHQCRRVMGGLRSERGGRMDDEAGGRNTDACGRTSGPYVGAA